MIRRFAVSLAAVLSFTVGAGDVAAEAPLTTLHYRQVYSDSVHGAESRMNRIYKRLAATLDDTSRKKLTAAQAGWVAHSDAECDFTADMVARGGTAEAIESLARREALIEQRTAELSRHLVRQESGK